MNQKPWEIEPRLSEAHLRELGGIIRDVRHDALDLHSPHDGDGPWSLGCRIYDRTINIIERKSAELSWLGFLRHSLYFVIFVDEVPLRFYHGPVDGPSSRVLRRKPFEYEYRQLTFSIPEYFWRIAVETDVEGKVLRLVLAQFDEYGNFINPWEIPLDEPVSALASATEIRREPAVLSKPVLVPRDAESDEIVKETEG